MSDLIASIDQGTTSTRCILFGQDGQVASSAQKEHRQIYPQPGWVEHDPLEIWQRTQEVVQAAMAALPNQRIPRAIGITNQRETTVIWHRHTGQPLYNAIVWQDTRTKKICDVLATEGGQDRFRATTGLPLATYFAGPKIKWLLENVPAVQEAAACGEACFGTIDSWLVWNLTGGPKGGIHITDATNASRTLLMDLTTLDWDAEILHTLQIPAGVLPRIVASSATEPWGYSQPDGPFGAAIPICGILGDQHAALVGQACFSPGEAKNTYGTGCFMLMNTGNTIVPSTSGLLTTLGYRFGDQPAVYALEGSIAITGALVQWLRDNLGLIEKSSDVEALAQTVSDNGGVYFVPAFSGLFAPHWRSDARGVIAGLTRYANKGHIARAALEATAFQTREVLDAMHRDSGVVLKALKVDGGMVYNQLLMQFQADLLDVPVVRPHISETTALGAAYAAGLSAGIWKTLDDLRANWQVSQTWRPQMSETARQKMCTDWQKAVQRSLNWA
ncbi:MAG: glycerol kinase GlpK [Chloroflexota bacterium]